jgi:hypothetical protein
MSNLAILNHPQSSHLQRSDDGSPLDRSALMVLEEYHESLKSIQFHDLTPATPANQC